MSDETRRKAARPITPATYGGIVEQRIADARADGMFDNLPGAGKPLENDENPLEPQELRTAHRLLKNNEFAPPWIEARRDIEREQAALNAWAADQRRRWPMMQPANRTAVLAEYRRRLTELRSSILNYNLRVPPAAGQLPLPNVEAEVATLGEKH